MIDIFAMLSTVSCVLYILFRAVMFDQSIPWFEREETVSGGPKMRDKDRRG
jgi:hypothetical protein